MLKHGMKKILQEKTYILMKVRQSEHTKFGGKKTRILTQMFKTFRER